jgi:hypothetical protein
LKRPGLLDLPWAARQKEASDPPLCGADTAMAFCFAAPCVAGWASISQSVWGAQLSDIQAQLSGGFSSAQTLAVPELQLGYLWSMPADSSDTRGLGGGITWAWDPELCGKMLGSFYQELVPGVNCDDLRAAMRRAFSAWSSESLRGGRPAAAAAARLGGVPWMRRLGCTDAPPPTLPQATTRLFRLSR